MKPIPLLLGGFFFIAGVIWIGNQDKPKQANTHHHGSLEVSEINKPSVHLEANKNSMGEGWDLHITTHNFRFSPNSVNSTNVEGEGHGHLYINDIQVTRIYGEWLYLNPLPAGKHNLRVSLNTNDHKTLLFKGRPIEATLDVIQP